MKSIWAMGELLVEIMRDRAGVPLSERGYFRGPFPSGAPAIFADCVSRLGVPSGIFGAVGRDDFGETLIERLQADGVDTRYVSRVDEGTACAFVSYATDGSRRFLFHFDGMAAVRATFRPPKLDDAPAYFHIMGCSLMANDEFTAEIFRAMEWFHESGAQVSFDPNIRVELLGSRSIDDVVGPVMNRASILFPGVDELSMLTSAQDIDEGVESLLSKYPNLETVVLKRGSKGALVCTNDGRIEVPAVPVDEVDPTGAGDFFDAGFLSALVRGESMERAAQLGARAGAANAAAFGPMEGHLDDRLFAI